MQTELPSDLPAVRIMTVTAGDTWSFSATGQWTNDCIRCGPDGYRNFLATRCRWSLPPKIRHAGSRTTRHPLTGRCQARPSDTSRIR
jgi:hypothetical protein